MESGVYQLFNDYRHFFSEDNKYNCEVIFDIEAKLPEYPTDYDQNIWRLNRPAPLKELVDTYLCVDGKTIEESPLYDPTRPYENRDPRLLKSIDLHRLSVFRKDDHKRRCGDYGFRCEEIHFL